MTTTRMTRRHPGLAPIAILGASLLAGCVESSMIAQTRHELEAEMPGVEIQRETAWHFGRLTTALGKRVALWALDEDEMEANLIRAIRRVDFAVYEVHSAADLDDGQALRRLENRLDRKGWQRMVRVKEADELTWVFLRENHAGKIRDLFVVAMETDEMVIVRVEGKLDRIMAELIADDPSGFGALLGG